MRVLTYGATGVQGGPVARRLAERGHDVRALVRDPGKPAEVRAAGIELVAGDLGDRDSLAAASRGADAVFFHLPLMFDRDTGLAYGRNAVDAARDAGVDLLVFNSGSIVPREDTGFLHLDLKRAIEGYCRQVGQPTIVLRPRLYFEVLGSPWVRGGLAANGTLAYPLPAHHRASWMTVEDVAAIAVAALERPDLAGSVFELGGPDALSGDDLAETFARLLGRPIAYHAVPVPEFATALQHNLGDHVGATIAESFFFFERCGPEGLVVEDPDAVARTFSVSLTPLEEWAAARDWSPTEAASTA